MAKPAFGPVAVKSLAKVKAMNEHHDDGLEDFLFAKTPQDLLSRWDAGDTVTSIRMSAIGPSYEQVIQILTFEILRSLITHEPADDEWDKAPGWVKKDTRAVTESLDASGNQFAKAHTLATAFYMEGHKGTLDEAPAGQHIKVCRKFPQGGAQ